MWRGTSYYPKGNRNYPRRLNKKEYKNLAEKRNLDLEESWEPSIDSQPTQVYFFTILGLTTRVWKLM
jgi:hypothetical protein